MRHNDPKMLQIILENTPGLDQDELAQGLLLTARKGYVECAEVLLAVGAPPDVHDMSGFTAIILAAKAGHLSVIQLLTNGKYSCNVNKANYRVRATAIHWAATNGHLACVQVRNYIHVYLLCNALIIKYHRSIVNIINDIIV